MKIIKTTSNLARIFCVFLTVFILFGTKIYSSDQLGANKPSFVSVETNVGKLLSPSQGERLEEILNLEMDRDKIVQNLIAIIDGSQPDDTRLDCAYLLGKYRDPRAIPVLIKNLNLDDKRKFVMQDGMALTREEAQGLLKPIKTALVEIGMPAIPALLDKITQTDNPKITGKCVSICQAIEGSEVTQFRLQRLLDKEIDPKKKERIQSALNALKKLNPEK